MLFRSNDTATTEIYTLSIHDALPIYPLLLEKLEAAETHDGDAAERLLQKALLQLPTTQRTTFIMRYYDEMTYEQMAAITGKSIGTLKTNYHYATERIKQYIQAHHDSI